MARRSSLALLHAHALSLHLVSHTSTHSRPCLRFCRVLALSVLSSHDMRPLASIRLQRRSPADTFTRPFPLVGLLAANSITRTVLVANSMTRMVEMVDTTTVRVQLPACRCCPTMTCFRPPPRQKNRFQTTLVCRELTHGCQTTLVCRELTHGCRAVYLSLCRACWQQARVACCQAHGTS